MKSSLLSVMLFLSGLIFAQKDTINTFRIERMSCVIYRGIDEKITDWYFYIDDEKIAYLANLFMDQNEVCKWFLLRRNSHTLLRSQGKTEAKNTFYMYRENEAETLNQFRYSFQEEQLVLESLDFGETFIFQKINIQE